MSPEALAEVRDRIDKENARLSRLAARATPAEISPQIASTADQPCLLTLPTEPVPYTSQNSHSESGNRDSHPEDRMDTLEANEFLTDQGNAENPNSQDIQGIWYRISYCGCSEI